MNTPPTRVEVLLIDDDDVDARSVERIFEHYRIAVPLVVISDPEEALAWLRNQTSCASSLQYVVLLDLNMPKMSGHEFLREIRDDPKLHSTVVFVLTTSELHEDKRKAYRHNIAGYLLKRQVEQDRESFSHLLQSYCRLVQFPPL